MNHNQLQAACYRHFRNTYQPFRHLLFSVNNNLTDYKGTGQDRARMAVLLSLGVQKGTTDFIFYFKGRLYGWDIKVGSDKLSPEQNEFIQALREQGGDGSEIRSLEDFQKKLVEIIGY